MMKFLRLPDARPRSAATAPRTGRVSLPLIVGGVLWLGVFASLFAIWQLKPEGVGQASQSGAAESDGAAAASGEQSAVTKGQASAQVKFPARQLPDFKFEEANGGSISRDALKGHPWVASFVFTRCVTTCPTITLAMKRLHDQVIEKNKDVQFVTFTVDPEYDTVEVLKQYSDAFSPDRDRWKFLTSTQEQLFDLILNGFGLVVMENVGAARRPGFEVAHSNRVVLVNDEGIPVATFLATRDEDMVELRKILTGLKPFPEPSRGLTFSSSDGSLLPVEFEVRKTEDDTGTDEASDTSSSSEPDAEDSSAAGDRGADETRQEISAAEHNALIDKTLPGWMKRLPTINASLNGLATCLLASGYVAIRSGRVSTHQNLMISAFAVSVAFLICYLVYHYYLSEYTGTHGRRFSGEGFWANVYPLILWPHVALAACVPFLAIGVFRHAFAERWDAHKRLARLTLPIWMYVSVTGVVIYGMLYHWPAA